jgi:septum formation protein
MMLAASPIVLASASTARRRMLEAAGVTIAVDPAAIDEEEVKRSFRAGGGSAEDCATALAEAKALRVSARHQSQLVLGADQILEAGGEFFDKPRDRGGAAAQLAALAGRRHRLISAAAVARNGAAIWHHVDRAELLMRPLSKDFIGRYLEVGGDAALTSVGAYQLEGLGAQLFERVEGDFFTILGLPLLPVLAFLRDQGVLPR